MLRCEGCGVERQDVRMTVEEYWNWYARDYHAGVYYHSYDQDVRVAGLRLDDYDLPMGASILDVGSGNGAFVHEARKRGFLAWGVEPGTQAAGPLIYAKPIADCHFPTGSFDAVTIHDVLEHIPDPRAFLQEVARILKPGGRLLLDWPAFHAPDNAGAHHWKPVEHLWMLTDDQVMDLLISEGFLTEGARHPRASRSVFHAVNRGKVAALPARILVPAGIGDGYWVATKLRAFMAAKGIKLPDIWVHSAGPNRSGDFWRSIPFVRFAGYAPLPKGPFHDRAFTMPGHPVQADVPGFDYFVSLNGALEGGVSIDKAIAGPTEWRLPLFHSRTEDARVDEFQKRFGRYVAVAFWDQGFYQKWLRDFPLSAIVTALRNMNGAGYKVVVMGAAWDAGGITAKILAADTRFVDLVGDTSYEDLVALIRGASGVFGFPAGNTMLGAFLDRPTLLLWNRHFQPSFWTGIAPPGAPHYEVLPSRIPARQASAAMIALMRRFEPR